MKLRITLAILALFTASFNYSQEAKAPKFGKGLFNLVGQDSSWTMKVGLRMQLLGSSVWEEDAKSEASFLTRRARLKFDGYAYSPKLKYKIELGLSNRDQSGASDFTHNAPRYILDAQLRWNFYKNFEIWFGQGKLPGNRDRVISSANLQQVDRSLLNSKFTLDRDFGFQLRHHFNLSDTFVVKEIFSLAQGEGRNITRGNIGGHEYTGRIELFPFGEFTDKGDYKGADLKREQTPKLSIGVTYDYNNNAVKTRGNQGSYMFIDGTDNNGSEGSFFQTNINTLFIDTMFKYRGFSLMAEYSDRNADDIFAKNSDGTKTNDVVLVGDALNLQTGYLLKEDWEVSLRYTNVDWDRITNAKDQTQYTLGLSKYIVGHALKVQTDISHLEVPGGKNELMYRLQFDIHF